jgi:hypothetical protein
MNHKQLQDLFGEILERGEYGSGILIPRLRRHLKKVLDPAVFDRITLQSSKDLAGLPVEALAPAAEYFSQPLYGRTPDSTRAADIARRAS